MKNLFIEALFHDCLLKQFQKDSHHISPLCSPSSVSDCTDKVMAELLLPCVVNVVS